MLLLLDRLSLDANEDRMFSKMDINKGEVAISLSPEEPCPVET